MIIDYVSEIAILLYYFVYATLYYFSIVTVYENTL